MAIHSSQFWNHLNYQRPSPITHHLRVTTKMSNNNNNITSLSSSPALDCFMARLRTHHSQNSLSAMDHMALVASGVDRSSDLHMTNTDNSFSSGSTSVLHLVSDNARSRSSSLSSQQLDEIASSFPNDVLPSLPGRAEPPSVNEIKTTKGEDRWYPISMIPRRHRKSTSSSSVTTPFSKIDDSPTFPSRRRQT